MTESFILGKDASLETSIETLQQRLTQLGFHIVERSWLNPVAHVWSVHIADRDCPLLFTNGKGASRKAALASALGEFFERLATNYFWADYYLGASLANAPFVHYPSERWVAASTHTPLDKSVLTPTLRKWYDPDKALKAVDWLDTNAGSVERGVCTLPFVRQRDGATVWFPVNVIGNLYVSNGMSAGNTPTEARTQALSEIFERQIKFRIIAQGLSLPEVPASVLEQYPSIVAGIEELKAAGFGIQVRDASLGGHYPVICVVLLNPHDQGVYASFGAHPRFQVALERALTELLQGRALEKLAGFPEPSTDLEEVAQPHNLETHFIDSSGLLHWNFLRSSSEYPFVAWDFTGTTAQECEFLVERLHQEGLEVYIMDYEHLGVYACRILVPGFSEIYPPDDLQWDNNNAGVAVRERILIIPHLDAEASAALLEDLDEAGFDEAQPVAALIGLAPDAGSVWEDLRVGELKGLLALQCGDTARILEACQWVRFFAQVNAKRRNVYACLEALIELEQTETLRASLTQLYGADAVATASQALQGDLHGLGVNAPGLALEGCVLHQGLLAAYRKVHQELGVV